MRIRIFLLCLFCFLAGAAASFYYASVRFPVIFADVVSPIAKPLEEKVRPLEAYSLESLARRQYAPGKMEFGEIIATESGYTAQKYRFESDGRWITGLAHFPVGQQLAEAPVIIQSRGYVPRDMFESGVGTRRSAEVYAANGFISLAPDFLGYGGSDNPSDDVFEERFQTYTALLNLYFTVRSGGEIGNGRIGLWGHSNGGQITLTALEVLGLKRAAGEDIPVIPATLWAPVTKRFPYSILYYTDEAEDGGKALRKKLADFEALYDADRFALTSYLEYVKGPLLIHQGQSDADVPVVWSDAFVAGLRELDTDVTYYSYPGADHNMLGSWGIVVDRDVRFFSEYLRY